jgi:uncharacterized protein YwgA
MTELKLTKSKEVLIHLINKLNELGFKIDGRKKIIKLMFLIEHYDPQKHSKLSEHNFIGNKFIIYRYGVYSFNVRDDYFDLCEEKIITEEPTFTLKQNDITLSVQPEELLRIDRIIDEFGGKTGGQLEIETLRMLGLNKRIKKKYYGFDVSWFIARQNVEN